jgi:alginate O-acetyltransferase complex protein AlgI
MLIVGQYGKKSVSEVIGWRGDGGGAPPFWVAAPAFDVRSLQGLQLCGTKNCCLDVVICSLMPYLRIAMIFASNLFLLYFLPVFLVVYLVTPQKLRNLVALVGSLLFYAWGAPKFVFVLLGIAVLDYFVALQIGKRDRHGGRWLTLAVVYNLGLLLYFKYANFFIDNTNAMLTQMGMHNIAWTAVALPLGISFFTFQQLSYLIDVYRAEKPPLKNPIDYVLLVGMFPHLVAGPILRYRDMADQLQNRRAQENISFRLSGLIRFAIGLGRKVLIADTLGIQVHKIFALPHAQLDFVLCWIGAIGFAFMVYHDFAGYSDMAIGLARMIGFRFPENFNVPFSAASVTEFWQRWHITLGSWMRNYLYIPLGGNRSGKPWLTYRNLVIVFLASGLWHGAAWTFIFFGLWHGFWMALERMFLLRFLEKVPRFLRIGGTFLAFAISCVFFSAKDMATVGAFFKEMVSFQISKTPWEDLHLILGNKFWFMGALAAAISLTAMIPKIGKWQERTFELPEKASHTLAWTAIALILLVLSVSEIATMGFRPFIYYTF